MNDKTTTIDEIRNLMRAFNAKRGWDKNQDALNIVMALSVETAELMEIFQWLHPNEACNIKNDYREYEHLQEEIADIFWYLMEICDYYDVDLTTAVREKRDKNAIKYPE